uniref:C6 domain-containing protein n=2 Tax=Caenorhabditis tropicalis TaxID=1561998 RepID=A0A1I7UFU4_9PELO
MISAVVLFLSAITVSNACVPTTTTTTTVPCCTMLSQSVLPRRTPSSTANQQCSVLQRVSSTCPVDGIVVCAAAQETNPSSVILEFFDSAGTVVRSQDATGSPATSVTVRVVCVNGVWRVPSATGSATTNAIASVSCSQLGSVGRDLGYVIGTAV